MKHCIEHIVIDSPHAYVFRWLCNSCFGIFFVRHILILNFFVVFHSCKFVTVSRFFLPTFFFSLFIGPIIFGRGIVTSLLFILFLCHVLWFVFGFSYFNLMVYSLFLCNVMVYLRLRISFHINTFLLNYMREYRR